MPPLSSSWLERAGAQPKEKKNGDVDRKKEAGIWVCGGPGKNAIKTRSSNVRRRRKNPSTSALRGLDRDCGRRESTRRNGHSLGTCCRSKFKVGLNVWTPPSLSVRSFVRSTESGKGGVRRRMSATCDHKVSGPRTHARSRVKRQGGWVGGRQARGKITQRREFIARRL